MPSEVASCWLPTTQEILKMSKEEIDAYMRLMGWDRYIPSGDSIPFDGSSDLDHEEALYQPWLGEDGDEDQ